MATSLAEQLKRLQTPQTALFIQKKKRASLLFDPKEAANLDRETVFEIGKNGLDELIKLCDLFEDFKNHLFAQSSVGLERSVHDQALNKKLDGQITRFLILLSPYFLLNPAHKTLEWLIHRFHIHEFNRDEFLMLIMPYHETRMFVRALQLVDVSAPGDKWNWLEPLQKPGVPLSKTTLINRLSSDNGLLRLLCDHVSNAAKVCRDQASSLGTLYAFYTMSVIGALEGSKSIKENQLIPILRTLGKGLTSAVPDFAASSYMLVAKICSKAKLRTETLIFMLNATLANPPLKHESILMTVFLFNAQSERLNSIPVEIINKLSSLSWFPEMLAKAKSSGANILKFVVALLASCIRYIQEDVLDVNKDVQTMVTNVLNSIKFSDEEVEAILKSTLQLHVSLGNISKDSTKFLVNFFHSVERQYPEKFDAYLKELVKKGESDKESEKILGLLLSWHADIRSAQGTMQVLDRLHHVNPEQRIAGLNLIASGKVQVSQNYRQMLNDALLTRFRDDDDEVILTLLTKFSVEKLRSIFTPDILVDELLKLVLKSNPYSPKVFGTPALRILLGLCSRYDTRVFITVLPYLFPRNTEEVKISVEVLCSDYAKNNDYMQMVKKDAGEKPGSPEAISSAAFHRILDINLLPSTSSILSTLKEQEIYCNAANMFFSMILLGSVCRVPVGSLPHEVARDIIDIASKVVKDYPNVQLLPNCNQLNGDKIVGALELASKGILPLQVGTYVLEMVHRRLDLSSNPTLDFEGAPDRSNLVIHFLQIFFQGINNPAWCTHYLWCLKIFLKRHFANEEDTICFLSQLFTKPVSPQTSLHCLQITSSLLDSKNSLLWAFTDCTFVPHLLVALGSENPDCRKSAVKILDKLSHTFNLDAQGFSTLLRQLADRKFEIKIDHEQLSLILYTLLSPDPDVQDQITPKLRSSLQEGLALLLTTVTREETPIHTVSQILDVLSHVNGLTVIQRLAPLGIALLDKVKSEPTPLKFAGNALRNILQRFDASTAKALADDQVWNLFEKSMKDYTSPIRVNNGYICPSVILMKQIDETFFEHVGKLGKSYQAKILGSLIDAVTDCEISTVVAAGNRAVKRIRLNAQLIIDELTSMKGAKAPLATPHKRKSKSLAVAPNPEIVNSRGWKRGITLLEFVQRADSVEKEELLLPVLFELLGMALKFEEQSIFEYTKQLLLSSILRLMTKSVAIQQAHQHVDLIAQCIRTSQNPQTHHHALLVLVELFKVADLQSALHNIMPIFTFMGCSVLRQDDAYSIQIISKIIETIVPIVNAAKDEIHACKVLRVFVTSLPDIPEHRRGPLFVKLLQLLENHLHLFYLLTFESHVLHLSEKKDGAGRETSSEKLDFASNISHEFSPQVLLDVCVKLVRFVRALPIEVDEGQRKKFVQFSGSHIFDVNKNSAKQLRHYKYSVVQFLTSLLSSSSFVNKVAELDADGTRAVRDRSCELIVELFMFVQIVSKSVDLHQGKPKGQYWRVMLHYLYDALDNVNRILPDDMFIDSITQLIEHESLAVRKKALDLLVARLHQKRLTDDDRRPFLTLIDPLMRFLKTDREPQTQEREIIQQTVLMSLKLLAKVLAAEDPAIFRPILELTTELIRSRDGMVLASAVLCLAELCAAMRTHAIPHLTKFMPALLNLLRKKCHQKSPDVVVVSVVTALQKIVDSVGNFLSLYLEQLLFELVKLRARYTDTEDAKISPIIQRLKNTMQKLSASVPLRVLLPTVTKTYDLLVSKKLYSCVDPLMNVLADSFSSVSAQDLNNSIQDLAGFFLRVLQFREDESGGKTPEDVSLIEQSASKALVTLVLKLSEATFRPLFYRLYDWAARNPAHKLRNITFYRLSANIADSLKSLFVLFAGHFLKHAASLLSSNNSSIVEEPAELTLPLEANRVELIEAILLTLYRVFVYDPRNFVNEERFQTLAQPVVDQLENLVGGKEAYEKRSRELIVPCIASFAGAIQDDSLHKQLVYQTLLKTRHVKSYVRIGALNALVEIARKLGEDFMPLLPETVPFLAELLEDEDEETEKLAQNAVRTLEEVLDEPLQKYF